MHKDYLAKVEGLKFLNDSYFLLKVSINENHESLGLPGQFYELKIPESNKLRIPISIYNVENNTVSFMIKIIGEGTRALSKLHKDEELQVLGPLGNTFNLPQTGKKNLLISGGVGYAPLYFLKAQNHEIDFVWFHGGRDAKEIFPADRIYTNDGSAGIKGFVTEELELFLQEHQIDRIYTCGPKIMMEKIVSIASRYVENIDVSLEEYMACGLGVCYGCVTKIKSGDDFIYKTVCKDGPIFQGSEVIWDE